MKKINILKYSITVILTVLITLIASFLLLGGDLFRAFEQISLIRKVTTADSQINKNAMYFSKNSEEVGDSLIESYVDMIDDDYAMYFGEQDFDKKEDERKGISDKSIGISIATKNGEKYPTVLYVNRNSPAKKSGIKKGDKILKINDISLKNKTVSETGELIYSEKTSKLLLKRNNKDISVSVTPDVFTVDSVMWRMIDDVCLIKITEFEDSTVLQFQDALEFAENKKAKALVFDLRNNLGGYVESCTKILSKLCPEGTLVRMKYKDGSVKVKYRSDEYETYLPMAVIINGNTASAAEIFAMNIREFEKGKLVGEKTFGKGIAQTTYNLHDGTAVKFTTATIVDKNGETYHKKGIEPDIKVEFSNEQNENYLFLTDKQDTQLQKALETVK